MIYDTLRLAKALRISFTPEQSETLAQAFSESTEDSVATKLDIAGLKTDIANLKVEIAELRSELRTEIAAVRTEIAALRTEMAALKIDMVRWIVGAIAFNLLATIGVMIAVAELVLKTK